MNVSTKFHTFIRMCKFCSHIDTTVPHYREVISRLKIKENYLRSFDTEDRSTWPMCYLPVVLLHVRALSYRLPRKRCSRTGIFHSGTLPEVLRHLSQSVWSIGLSLLLPSRVWTKTIPICYRRNRLHRPF